MAQVKAGRRSWVAKSTCIPASVPLYTRPRILDTRPALSREHSRCIDGDGSFKPAPPNLTAFQWPIAQTQHSLDIGSSRHSHERGLSIGHAPYLGTVCHSVLRRHQDAAGFRERQSDFTCRSAVVGAGNRNGNGERPAAASLLRLQLLEMGRNSAQSISSIFVVGCDFAC